MKIGEKALAEALRYIGAKEYPAGSNKTVFGQWYGVNGVPWCAIFVSFCCQIGAGHTICAGYKGAGVAERGCAYVPTIEAWANTAGLWLGRVVPAPGDIAIFNWDGGVPDHIGIVERSTGADTFACIEGNTSTTNNSNGGEVMRQQRRLTQVDGFVRLL